MMSKRNYTISYERMLIYLGIIISILFLYMVLKYVNLFQNSYDKKLYSEIYEECERIKESSDNSNSSNFKNTNSKSIAENSFKSVTAILEIDKIGLFYPINTTTNYENLKISPTKFHGCEPNEIGNFCIVGHNNRDGKQFSRLNELENGDTIKITDRQGSTQNYVVYNKYTINENDLSCTTQKTNGKKVVTLITCTNDKSKRLVIQCKA